MSNYSAVICKLENVRKHPNADRLLLADACDEPIVIGLNHVEGEIGVFFPAGTVIDDGFLMANHLYRKNPIDGTAMGGYFESNRRVRFQKFRGEWSRGIWLPLNSLDYLCLNQYPVLGTVFQELEGHELISKYVEKSNVQRQGLPGKPRSKRYENFYEIGETPKLVMNYHRLKLGDVLVITEKLHGTSGRTGYLKTIPRPVKKNIWQKAKEFILNHVFGIDLIEEPEWAYVTGTRRMVLGENSPESNNYRDLVHDELKAHLSKGMIVYYEIVGEVSGMQTHTPIGIEDKTLKKDLLEEYGEEIKYTYGVPTGSYGIYIYKIVEHNVDGLPIVYSWDQLVAWCKLHGFNHVPVLHTMLYDASQELDPVADSEIWEKSAKNHLKFIVDVCCEGASVLDSRHPKEGIVIQTKYGPFKHKSDVFCMLEDIRPYEEPEYDTIEEGVEFANV